MIPLCEIKVMSARSKKKFTTKLIRPTLKKIHLTLSLPGTSYEGPNTDLPSKVNISKTVTVSTVFRITFLKSIW